MENLHYGIELYLSGNLHGAIKVLKEYLSNDGASVGIASYYIGVAYGDLQQLSEAESYLRKAVKAEPEKSMYHYKLGIIYSRLMILDDAIYELNKTLFYNPEHQRARFLLGTLYFKQGNMKKAYEIFTTLIKNSPDFAAAYYHRSLSLFHLGNTKEAIYDLEKSLKINEDYNEARIKLAQIQINSGQYTSAVNNLSKIYDTGLRDYIFLKLYIVVLYKMDNIKLAEKIADEASTLYPNNSDILNYID